MFSGVTDQASMTQTKYANTPNTMSMVGTNIIRNNQQSLELRQLNTDNFASRSINGLGKLTETVPAKFSLENNLQIQQIRSAINKAESNLQPFEVQEDLVWYAAYD